MYKEYQEDIENKMGRDLFLPTCRNYEKDWIGYAGWIDMNPIQSNWIRIVMQNRIFCLSLWIKILSWGSKHSHHHHLPFLILYIITIRDNNVSVKLLVAGCEGDFCSRVLGLWHREESVVCCSLRALRRWDDAILLSSVWIICF